MIKYYNKLKIHNFYITIYEFTLYYIKIQILTK